MLLPLKYIFSDTFLMLLKNQTFPLLKPPYVKYFAVCCFLMFGLFFVASGIAMYTPELFNKLALVNDKSESGSRICGIYDVKLEDKKVRINLELIWNLVS